MRFLRTSSLFSPRRRLRQWHLQGWFSMFRCYGRPKMLGFMDVMDKKDSCDGLYKVGIVGDNAPRAVFSSVVGKPMMLGIMAVNGPVRQRLHLLRQCACIFSAMIGLAVDTWFVSLWSFLRAPGI